MPELPEVETTRRGIEPLIVGKAIERLLVHNGSLRWPVATDLADRVAGQVVLSVGRRSKYLLVNFNTGTLLVHLGMTGHLRVELTGRPLRKHDHVELFLSDGGVLRYNDSRRFGSLLWTGGDPLLHPRLSKLGPEPFSRAFSAAYLYQRSRNRKLAIKQLLMDAQVVVGVGNIYASEALFRAGIAPNRPAGSVSKIACHRLVEAVREILDRAIAAGGTTIRDFSNSEGKPGYFSRELRVYGRAGQACTICQATIKLSRIGQRSTYYCPVCQK